MICSPTRIASLIVALASLVAFAPATQADEAAACCPYEDLGPGELRPGILDSCPGCRETRIYRSEILGRLWVRGEYLSWALKEQQFPALVSASLPGTPIEDAGILGRLGTHTLFGDDGTENGLLPGAMLSGGRLTGGFWFHPDQMCGIEANYFELDNRVKGYTAVDPAYPVARPFFNISAFGQDRLLVNFPPYVDGSINVASSTTFNGAEGLLRRVVSHSDWHRLDLVAGYRYSRLDDELQIFESIDAYPLGASTHIDAFDYLNVENQFHGGQAGAIMRWHGKYVGLQLLGKLALGGTNRRVLIDGGTATTTTVVLPVESTTITSGPGRLLALPTNMGSYSSTGFSAVGELGVSSELQLTCNCRLTFGYTFIYWSNVARVADQIDTVVNPTQMPPGALHGLPRPRYNLVTSDFWAQGLNFGLEYQF